VIADQPVPPPTPALAARVAAPAGLDPLTGRQGFLARINWTPPPAGGRRPLVAVLDTGVDASDPDLAGPVLRAAARSFVPGSPDPLSDPEGHGTHVAGIIAATSGNGHGGSGVAAARIIPVTIADADGATTTSALVRGLRYASARGARVINISFGGRGFSQAEQDAIDRAARRGALVVAAVGNSGGRGGGPDYPAAYRQVLAVAALGDDGRALGISLRGDHVALAAPGRRIAATAPAGAGDGLAVRTGTSMAAAVVTGAAARIIARRPGLDAQQVRAILESTARDVPPSGADSATGSGALDLAAALAAPAPPRGDPEPNDDIALAAATRPLLPGSGPGRAESRGRTGSPSDPRDVRRLVLRAGQPVALTLRGLSRGPGDLDLLLWRPGTPSGAAGPEAARRWLVGASLGPRADERIALTAATGGVHWVEVRGVRGGESVTGAASVDYALAVERGVTPAAASTRPRAERR
jgi:serine protease